MENGEPLRQLGIEFHRRQLVEEEVSLVLPSTGDTAVGPIEDRLL